MGDSSKLRWLLGAGWMVSVAGLVAVGPWLGAGWWLIYGNNGITIHLVSITLLILVESKLIRILNIGVQSIT